MIMSGRIEVITEAERNNENMMYNSDKTAVEITCCGACDCATYPFICLKNGCRCQATNRHTDANCTEAQ